MQLNDNELSHGLTPYDVIAELGSKFFRAQVIGDFPEAEARLFLQQALGATIINAEWADIFEASLQRYERVHSLLCCLFGFQVKCMHEQTAAALAPTCVQICGGNAGDLLSAAESFKELQDWTSGEICCVIRAWALLPPTVTSAHCRHSLPCCSLGGGVHQPPGGSQCGAARGPWVERSPVQHCGAASSPGPSWCSHCR